MTAYENTLQAAIDSGKLQIIAVKCEPKSDHDCDDNAVPYKSDGALGHGWECGICGKFLQAG
jgi:hypothetical protein